MVNKINVCKHLLESANSRGMVVRSLTEGVELHKFGSLDEVVIEGAQYRITFRTSVRHYHNYFNITKVEDLIKDRTYNAQRYFHKFITPIQDINSATYINMMKEELENGKQN